MTRRLRAPLGGAVTFLLVAGLVFGGLGWVTVSALSVEDAQRAAAAEAVQGNNLRVALWRLDGRMFAALGLEDNRPFHHYAAVHAPLHALADEEGAAAAAHVRVPSPLLAPGLPDWMRLHFQVDRDDGWQSPQVPPADVARKLREAWADLPMTCTPQRAALLDELKARHPPAAVVAELARREQAFPADLPLALPLLMDPVPPAPPTPIPLSPANSDNASQPVGQPPPPVAADPAAAATGPGTHADRPPLPPLATAAPEPSPAAQTAADPQQADAVRMFGLNVRPGDRPPARVPSADENKKKVDGYLEQFLAAGRTAAGPQKPQPAQQAATTGNGLRYNYTTRGQQQDQPNGEFQNRADIASKNANEMRRPWFDNVYAKAQQLYNPPPGLPPPAGANPVLSNSVANNGNADPEVATGGSVPAPVVRAAPATDFRGGVPVSPGGPPTPAAAPPPPAVPKLAPVPLAVAPVAGPLPPKNAPRAEEDGPPEPKPAAADLGGGGPAAAAEVGDTQRDKRQQETAERTARAGGQLAEAKPGDDAVASGSFALSKSREEAKREKEDLDRAARRPTPAPGAPLPPLAPAVTPPAPPPATAVAVHLGSMRPQWLTAADGTESLVLARAARLESKTVYQGVVLDWAMLREALKEEVKDFFPDARLVPVKDAAGVVSAERAMTALPVQLDPGPVAPPPPPGWTPLRSGLALAWVFAAVAVVAVGLVGRSLIDLSERRIRFVSAVTHELRTPLTSLRLYLDLLTSGLVTDGDKQKEYLSTLAAESDRLHRLVDNVLDFARLERRRKPAELQAVAVSELLTQVGQTWSDRCAADGKELVAVNTLPPGAEACTDPQLVQQIVGNLVDNARKYTRDAADRRIWLWAKPGGRRRVVLEVEDRGPGVPTRERRSIFRPFRRGESADTRAGGAGLGLALARQWAEAVGGRLTYRPADGGVGACFRLELPAKCGTPGA